MAAQHPLHLFRFCPVCGSARFEENNATSKRCADCGFVYYFNPRAAVVALIRNRRGELLTCRRAKEPAKGTFDLPGGFTESYETAEEAVAREVREETGLSVSAVRYLFSIPNIYPYSGMDIHTMDLFFECTVGDCSSVVADDDVAECFWLSPQDIRPEKFGLLSIRKGGERLVSEGV